MDHPRATDADTALDCTCAAACGARGGDDAEETLPEVRRHAAAVVANPHAQPGDGSDATPLDDRSATATVVAVLRAHGDSSADVAWRCIASLMELQELDANADTFGVVVLAMQSHAGCADVQAAGCALLARMTKEHELNRTAAGAAGAIGRVVDALRMHCDDANVQRFGFTMLHWTVEAHALNARAAGAAGAVQLIVHGMSKHAQDADVQLSSCGALVALMRHDETGGNADRVRAAGGLIAVVAALRAHRAEAMVQCNASAAVAKLAGNEAGRTQAIQAGAAEELLAALRTHAADAGVIEYVCNAMYNVCRDGGATLAAVRGVVLPTNMVREVIIALYAHSIDANVQK
jgi:hypothetical protein